MSLKPRWRNKLLSIPSFFGVLWPRAQPYFPLRPWRHSGKESLLLPSSDRWRVSTTLSSLLGLENYAKQQGLLKIWAGLLPLCSPRPFLRQAISMTRLQELLCPGVPAMNFYECHLAPQLLMMRVLFWSYMHDSLWEEWTPVCLSLAWLWGNLCSLTREAINRSFQSPLMNILFPGCFCSIFFNAINLDFEYNLFPSLLISHKSTTFNCFITPKTVDLQVWCWWLIALGWGRDVATLDIELLCLITQTGTVHLGLHSNGCVARCMCEKHSHYYWAYFSPWA